MSTRSFIGKLNANGSISGIYCHFDGYPSHHEPILKNYNTNDKVDQLLALGSLSILGSEIGEKQDFDNPTNDNWCLAYHRDRGEELEVFMTYESQDEMMSSISWADYAYLFDGTNWKTLEV